MANSGQAFAATTAASMWTSSCAGYNSSMGMPVPTSFPPAYGSYATINVYYMMGYYQANPHACAGYSPGAIFVFQYANDPNGVQVSCASVPGGFAALIAHELGHYYGLGDIYSGCSSYMMAQVNGQSHYVHGEECQKANDLNSVYMEFQPNPCNQPCGTVCTNTGECPAFNGGSPIVLNVKGRAIRLTSPDVEFDLLNRGTPQVIGWTQPDGETAFLVLDRNGDERINDGTELFGDHTVLPDGTSAPNGYLALSWFDRPEHGGNGDGVIDSRDQIFNRLRLWFDDDHDGVSRHSELRPLDDAGVQSISLGYVDVRKTDSNGNVFRYRSSADIVKPNGKVAKVATFDVYFKVE